MIATLSSYESMFGPYHLQTLALAVQVALALRPAGEPRTAQMLLEHAVKHLERHGDQANSLRLAVQKEIVRSKTLALRQDNSDLADEQADLIRILLSPEQAGAPA